MLSWRTAAWPVSENNQSKAWEENTVLVHTNMVYFLKAENERTLGSLYRLMSGFLKQSRFGLPLLRVIMIKGSKPNLSRICSALYFWDSDPQMCSFTHRISPRAFLQEHCTFCFDVLSLSVCLDRIRIRGIYVRHIAVWCKK